MKTTMYKVALAGGKWKKGFATVQAATAFANQTFMKTGVLVAVEAYRPK